MDYLDNAEALRRDMFLLIREHYEGTAADFTKHCDEIALRLRAMHDEDAADMADFIFAIAHDIPSQVVGM